MLIENSDALKKYLMESLSRISDADPGALSRYILALLKKPRTEADLKVFFLDQLEVFLMRDTATFVEQLFEAIKSKSYLPTKENIPKQEKSESSEKGDFQSSENLKSRRKEKNHAEAESFNKKNRSLSLSSSRSRSSSPEKNSRDKEKDSLSTHIYETLKEGVTHTFLKNREKVMSPKTPPPEKNPVHSPTNTTTSEYTVQTQNEKLSKRCKDYDERGYCLLGDSCRFNHGLDPLIVEDVSVLNFAHVLNDSVRTSLSVCEENEAALQPPPPPPPSTSPPPPPPPLPITGLEYIPEPYNPECPAMERQKECENYYSVSLQRSFQVPSLIPTQPQSSIQTRVQNSKPLRSRELIGVPTVDCKNESQPSSRKRKGGFDYSRLGPKPKRIISESTTLELRRVPSELNSITTLHDHFSSFGKIMNIQVCYDGDPEASLVTFAAAAEATAAYKSTKAVLNNRFIKVFLHDDSDKRGEKNKDTEKERNVDDTSEKKLDSLSHTYSQRDFHANTGLFESVIYSKGNLSKTVFLKKNNTKTDVSSLSSQGKSPKDERKHAVSKLDLYKKKQEFLEAQIQHQKLIVERLKITRNAKQRDILKKMIEDRASKIMTLENELKCFFEKEKCNSQNQKAAIAERKKELLDAEMDLYKTLNKGDESDTSVLLMKVHELKEKAKAFGLLDSSCEQTELKVKHPPHTQRSVTNFSKLLKTDNRPKSLLVSGIEDQDFLVNFLQKFPGIETISSTVSKGGCVVILNSRKAAETMLHTLNGFALGNDNLSVSWFQDDQQSVSEDVKDAKEKNDSIHFVDGDGDGDEDDDEEEDSEARSWRR